MIQRRVIVPQGHHLVSSSLPLNKVKEYLLGCLTNYEYIVL